MATSCPPIAVTSPWSAVTAVGSVLIAMLRPAEDVAGRLHAARMVAYGICHLSERIARLSGRRREQGDLVADADRKQPREPWPRDRPPPRRPSALAIAPEAAPIASTAFCWAATAVLPVDSIAPAVELIVVAAASIAPTVAATLPAAVVIVTAAVSNAPAVALIFPAAASTAPAVAVTLSAAVVIVPDAVPNAPAVALMFTAAASTAPAVAVTLSAAVVIVPAAVSKAPAVVVIFPAAVPTARAVVVIFPAAVSNALTRALTLSEAALSSWAARCSAGSR